MVTVVIFIAPFLGALLAMEVTAFCPSHHEPHTAWFMWNAPCRSASFSRGSIWDDARG